MSLLFARLRSGTEQQHRQIEAIVDPMHTFSSLEAHKPYLLHAWIFHAAVGDELSGLDGPDPESTSPRAARHRWLEHALRILGVSYRCHHSLSAPGACSIFTRFRRSISRR